MSVRLQKTIAIILLIVISISAGFLIDFLLDKLDEWIYPKKYTTEVEKYSELYGVPEAVIYATIKTESGFRSDAVSDAGAIGLMQIMPETFVWLQEMLGEELDERMLYDPDTNIKYGTYLLSYLYDRYGIWETVYAAYNAGIGRVNGWLKDPNYANEYGELTDIPITETRNYVKKVAKAKEKYISLYE